MTITCISMWRFAKAAGAFANKGTPSAAVSLKIQIGRIEPRKMRQTIPVQNRDIAAGLADQPAITQISDRAVHMDG